MIERYTEVMRALRTAKTAASHIMSTLSVIGFFGVKCLPLLWANMELRWSVSSLSCCSPFHIQNSENQRVPPANERATLALQLDDNQTTKTLSGWTPNRMDHFCTPVYLQELLRTALICELNDIQHRFIKQLSWAYNFWQPDGLANWHESGYFSHLCMLFEKYCHT